MRTRVDGQDVELEGSLGDIIEDVADDRCGVAGLFFAALLGSGEGILIEDEP